MHSKRGERGKNRGPWLHLACLCLFIALPACATSQEARLERRADRVESRLLAERTRVLAMPAGNTHRNARLDHLTQLRTTLSAANVARGTVPYFLNDRERPAAYSVLEEVYSTIEWNIPLGPDEAQRPLPPQFRGNTLNLDPQPPAGEHGGRT